MAPTRPLQTASCRPCQLGRIIIVLCTSLLARTAAAQATRGRVVSPDGAGIGGASVELRPNGTSVHTTSSGMFDLGNLQAGAYTVTVRRIGFAVANVDFSVPVGPSGLVVTLQPLPVMLDTLHTDALQAQLPRVFLRDKAKLGSLLYGSKLQDLFARADGRPIIESLLLDRRTKLQYPAKPCGTWILVDDKLIDPQFPVDFYIDKRDIAAVEVFSSPDFVHEPYVDAHRLDFNSRCRPVILIWSKWYQSEPWAGH